jgi:hypothetical protein
MLGETLLPNQPEADCNDVMHAARAHMQRMAEEHEAKTADRQAKRQARREAKQKAQNASKPPNANQQLQARLQGEADTHLRALYRQLASALHPDREPDPDARQHKTALMGEANAAYARKDYLSLVDIQQRAALANPRAVAPLPEDQLQALTLLLKAQVAEMERQRAHTQEGLRQEFDVPSGMPLDASTLHTLLSRKKDNLQREVSALDAELSLLQQATGLQRWLAQQRKRLVPAN